MSNTITIEQLSFLKASTLMQMQIDLMATKTYTWEETCKAAEAIETINAARKLWSQRFDREIADLLAK